MNVSYYFLFGAGAFFILAIIMLFTGTKKKEKNSLDPQYPVMFQTSYFKANSISGTLDALTEYYEAEKNKYMLSLIEKAQKYLGGEYGDYEMALSFLNPQGLEEIDNVHMEAIRQEIVKKKGLPFKGDSSITHRL